MEGMRRATQQPGGFTLIELLLVCSIIAILMATGIAAFSGMQTQMMRQRASADLTRLSHALSMYVNQTGDLPLAIAHRDGKFNAIAELVEGVTTLQDAAGPLLDIRPEETPNLTANPVSITHSQFFDTPGKDMLDPAWQPLPSSTSSTIWRDLNSNGTQDTGEVGRWIYPMVDPWHRPYVFSVKEDAGARQIVLYSFGPKVLIDETQAIGFKFSDGKENDFYKDDDVYTILE